MLSAQTLAAAQCWFLQSYLFKNPETFPLKNQHTKSPNPHTHIICAWKYLVERNKLCRGLLNNLTDRANKNDDNLNLLAFCSCGNTCGLCVLRL